MEIPYIETTITPGGTIVTPFGPKDMPPSSVAIHKTLTVDDATIAALRNELAINGATPTVPLTSAQAMAALTAAIAAGR